MRRGRHSHGRFRAASWRRVGERARRSSVGSKGLRRRVKVFSWEGRAREEKQDAGVGVEKGVKKNGGHEAIFCSIDTCESGAEEGEGDEGGSVEMDGTEGEGNSTRKNGRY